MNKYTFVKITTPAQYAAQFAALAALYVVMLVVVILCL